MNSLDSSLPTVQVIVNGNSIHLKDQSPTVEQILHAAQCRPSIEYVLIAKPEIGPTYELGLEEVVNLADASKFYARKADSISYFILNDERYAWFDSIDEGLLRELGNIEDSQSLWFEQQDEADIEVNGDKSFSLSSKGIERFYSKAQQWVLDVHGVKITSNTPQISVREALSKAGVDPDQGWIIILKVKDLPKAQLSLNDIIDLTRPGIERLRLTPGAINNGEAQIVPNAFTLLAKDEAFLTESSYLWRTIIDGSKRWLIIENYTLPTGYVQSSCAIAIEIPATYPTSQLDMFYCHPNLSLLSKQTIPQTQVIQTIEGKPYQRWSRHRSNWSPMKDSVISQLGVVEESIIREVV
ncbi:multiubiquitin domain-containing protein [Shewanella sp. 4t3-1-2LB]|uniref:multiubiquitin domain-containing protein n=1 Tax=Shewanella sp. 4t3-1-2LB TaxID=2817682 RepID=UPI001A99B7E8|nr:multiubiquitin domain-containing protein [Shewanella sp. 4t3-1-2LB]MBO1273613.1 multiubiquitin domain-containing protein [Shewanella sp. 4t3-1-2LB]